MLLIWLDATLTCESNAWKNWHTFDSRHMCWRVLCETSARAGPTCSHTQNRPVKQYSKAEMYASLCCQVSCKSYVVIGKLRLSSQVSSLLGQVSSPLGMARVNKGSHSFTCLATHMFIAFSKWNGPYHLSHRASLPFCQYSFPAPLRVGGWVGLGGWLHTETVYMWNDHPSQYINWARHR